MFCCPAIDKKLAYLLTYKNYFVENFVEKLPCFVQGLPFDFVEKLQALDYSCPMKKQNFDDKYLSLVATDFACYLSWLEQIEEKTLDPKKMKSLIKKFFQVEKKAGHIDLFNETDINIVAMLVFSFDPIKIKKIRKKTGWDNRAYGFKKFLGIK